MVHALEKIHRLLIPSDGLLVDIHPDTASRTVHVRIDHELYSAGEIINEERADAIRQADRALAEATAQGLYALSDEHRFSFRIYCDTLDDFHTLMMKVTLIGEELHRAALDSETRKQVEVKFHLPGSKKEIILLRSVTIRGFKPIC